MKFVLDVMEFLVKKFENESKVLLLKRSTSILRDVWCYIGGSVEAGEKAWEAALREDREETGITNILVYKTNKFDQIYSFRENYIYVAPVFVGYVNNQQEVSLNYEHSEYKWLTVKEALEMVTLPGNMELGDTFEDTAHRELFEETGLTANSLELIIVVSGKEFYYQLTHGDEMYNATAVNKATNNTGTLKMDNESIQLSHLL